MLVDSVLDLVNPIDERQHRKFSSYEGRRGWKRGGGTPERAYKHILSYSPNRSRNQSRRSPSYENQRSPLMSLRAASEDVKEQNETADRKGKTSQLALSSSSAERRQRRYKVAVLEGQRVERKKEGKKPFYLTLNNNGEPYGPDRPAWVAEVNKLAAALDPPCTHIRKQTYDDMCLLKDRLDDHFEYSGELNQDYLRSMLGKAVTRRRTDLISYIKKDGK